MTDDALGLLGTTVADKYEVERVVGEGGFAVVYRAIHTLWKRPVALKVFKSLADLPDHARDELTQNFIREGALLAELSEKSTSICQARDVGVLTAPSGVSVPYMVLEWLEGESLEEALQREAELGQAPRTLAEAMRLLDPVAEALALAHERGIAHRDVKPANIFLLGRARDERCPVKLLDFGIAKVVLEIQKSEGAFTKTSGTLTAFTPAYAAPEQFSRSHGPTGPWTDVFALALVVVELMTGRAPLDGDDFLQLGVSAANPNVRPTPRTRGAEASDAVESVFLKALAVDRSARYASADVFWRDLKAAAAGARTTAPRVLAVEVTGRTLAAPYSVTTAKPVVAPDPSVPAAKSRVWIVVVVAALLGAAGVGLLSAFRQGKPSAAAAEASAKPPALPASAAPSPPCPEGMVLIPGGPFFMGADDGLPQERPQHKVEVAAYCMDVTEVTTAKYAACSDGGMCIRAAETNLGDVKASEQAAYDALCNERDRVGRAQHPINCVTWAMADVYCRVNGGRLPSEAEWEFAARGKDGRTYPWGNQPPSAKHLNACGRECLQWARAAKVGDVTAMYPDDDGWPNTAPVGSFPQGRSTFGVLDLAGNVWEWVGDWYGPYTAGDGVTAEKNPRGGTRGDKKVIRGGGWNGAEASWERPSFRYWKDPNHRNHGVGFRCAADAR